MLFDLLKNKGQEGRYCEKVLGSTPRVDTMASFIDTHATLLHLIELNSVLEFIEENNPSPDEFAAFKAGVGAMGKFLSDCSKERESRKPKNDTE